MLTTLDKLRAVAGTKEGDTMNAIEAVIAERRRRGWSVRQAALRGGVSNTAWGDMEATIREPSDRLRRAVADAFDWPLDWYESPPTPPQDETTAARLHHLEEAVDRLGELVDELLKQRENRYGSNGDDEAH